jgi:ribosomal protein S18 acetylase RimI-like enzyme
MPVHELNDPERLFNSLALEPERSALLCAFLDTFGPGDSAWTWRAGGATNISFLVYLTRTAYSPILFGFGPPAGMEQLLDNALPHLPERMLLHFPVNHRDAIERVFFHEMKADLIFSMTRQDLAPPERRVSVAEIGESDLVDVQKLMSQYPDNFFRDDELRSGLHLGVRDGGRLVAFTSAPVVSTRFRRAFLSNVVTDESARRKGYARALSHALAARLFEQGTEVIGLGAFAANTAARALYESLGFHFQYHNLFGPGAVRGAASGREHSHRLQSSV